VVRGRSRSKSSMRRRCGFARAFQTLSRSSCDIVLTLYIYHLFSSVKCARERSARLAGESDGGDAASQLLDPFMDLALRARNASASCLAAALPVLPCTGVRRSATYPAAVQKRSIVERMYRAVAVTSERYRPLSKSFPRFLSTGVARLGVGSAVSRSVQVEADLEPGGMAGELQESSEIRQLLNLCGEHGRLGDVLFAAADAAVRLDKETTAARP